MTELEKLNERIAALEVAIAQTQHAAVVDRKMSHDKHPSGHYTKALTELTSLQSSLKALAKRYEAIGR